MGESGWERVLPYLDPNQKPHAVDLLIVEGMNVIWKYTKKYRMITRDQALGLYERMMKLVKEGVIAVEPGEKYLQDALKIAINHDISVYDGLFLAQAKSLKAKLVTGDRKQREVAEMLKVSTVYID
jgi:predicted nucleic acid-binding protein